MGEEKSKILTNLESDIIFPVVCHGELGGAEWSHRNAPQAGEVYEADRAEGVVTTNT